ncbi:MAG: septum site-determining protein MinC [Comamonadaceae bacterium]|nr:MAG: septum site-determining protein MinC [Comamonadaceae bacterium]
MTVALAGRAPATFEIKSANLPLVSLLLKSCDLATLAQEMKERFGDIPDFFDQDPLVIDLTPLQAQGEVAVEFTELLHLLRAYGVVPVAARGGSKAQMAAARLVGLAAAPEARALERPARAEPEPALVRAEPTSVRAEPVEALRQAQGEREKAQGERERPHEHVSALIVDKPLRSGQQVYARGRDLVVLSMVNPGAEVIADGHIHVYAPLRGKAIAGARGNADARILSLCMEPELISIAGVYRTSEVPLPAEVRGKPCQVRLDGGAQGKLVMTPLKN